MDLYQPIDDRFYREYDSLFDNTNGIHQTKMIYLFYNSGRLTKRERMIMRDRFGFITGKVMTQKAVATKHGVTISCVRMVENKIVRKLHRWDYHMRWVVMHSDK